LSLRALALANATNYFSAYYLRVDNVQIPLDGEDSAQLASDDRHFSGEKVLSSFSLEQRPPSADGNDDDYLEYAVELDQFATAKDAAAALTAWPKAFTSTAGSGQPGPNILSANPPKLGDHSAMVSVIHNDRGNGVNAPGSVLYVSVGAVLMIVTVESPAKPAEAAVLALVKADLACLTGGACDPLPIPDGLGA
jgi:hypothetical protein